MALGRDHVHTAMARLTTNSPESETMLKKYDWYLKIGSFIAALGITCEFVGLGAANEFIELGLATGGLYLCFWTVAQVSAKKERTSDHS